MELNRKVFHDQVRSDEDEDEDGNVCKVGPDLRKSFIQCSWKWKVRGGGGEGVCLCLRLCGGWRRLEYVQTTR